MVQTPDPQIARFKRNYLTKQITYLILLRFMRFFKSSKYVGFKWHCILEVCGLKSQHLLQPLPQKYPKNYVNPGEGAMLQETRPMRY